MIASIRIERDYRDGWGVMRRAPDATVERLEQALRRAAPEPQFYAGADHRCFEPEWMERNERLWGIAVQLYGIRTARNWGIGDFTDLQSTIALAASQSADFVGVNPLHALFAAEPARCSPYSPSSREYLNVLYIDPGAAQALAISPAAQRRLADLDFQERLAALRATPLVEYEQVAQCKDEVFRLLFADFAALCAREPTHPLVREFSRFVKDRGESLRRFAIYQALCCRAGFGCNWRAWPEAFRDPAGPGVDAFARDDPLAVAYQEFLQWEADAQLAACADAARRAGMKIGLYLDLAVGTGPESSEAWSERENIIPGFHIGAPPDAWNEAGQDWGFAVYDPYRQAQSEYRVFRRILRALMRHASALRIDHVLGFYRLFLVPSDGKPADGVYLHLPASALCDVLAEASCEARCVVIGEDLGAVPEEFPALLAAHRILSCRLLVFARDGGRSLSPQEYPRSALVSAATHDLPPFLGYLAGTDIDIRARLGLYADDAQPQQACEQRAADSDQLKTALANAGFSPGADPVDFAVAAHGYLARTPSALFLAQLDDLALEREQVNFPGIGDRYPSWRRKLSRDLDAIFSAETTAMILGAIRRERPRAATS